MVVAHYGESLSFGCDDSKDLMIQLIVDDGVSDRGHRKNLFDASFNVVGCYSCKHKTCEMVTCLDYCGEFI